MLDCGSTGRVDSPAVLSKKDSAATLRDSGSVFHERRGRGHDGSTKGDRQGASGRVRVALQRKPVLWSLPAGPFRTARGSMPGNGK